MTEPPHGRRRALLGWASATAAVFLWLYLYWLDVWHGSHVVSDLDMRWLTDLGAVLVAFAVALFGFTQWNATRSLPVPAVPGSQSQRGRANRAQRWIVFGVCLLAVVAGAGVVTVRWAVSEAPRTCVCPPYEIAMTLNGSTEPASGLFYGALAVAPTPGLATGDFELRLESSSDVLIPAGTAPTSCTPALAPPETPFGPSDCGIPVRNWYAVLIFHNGTVASTFDASGHWRGPSVAVTSSQTLYVVSDSNLTTTDDVLAACSTDSVLVSGSGFL